jgi:uncharacterized protein YlxW (UPF0749 family)
MTDPDDTAGDATSGAARGEDDRGGTPPARPPHAQEEPTVPFASFRPAVPQAEADEPSDGDEPTVSLTGRDLITPSAPGRDLTPPPAPARDGEAEREPAVSGAMELPAAGAGHHTAGGPGEKDAGDGAPAVPLGDLDLGESVTGPRTGEAEDTSPDPSISAAPTRSDPARPRIRRPAPAGTLIWVLLALLGFTLVVQLRSNDADDGLAATRQEDLVRILSDLESEDSRLLAQIQALEQSKQQLNSEVGGREAALAEAERRSQDLGLLAGTVPGRGPGLDITLSDVRASDVLNTVQELRGAGGEVMQLSGANGVSVRLVASSFFVDASGGGIIADGEELTGPFRLLVIGPASTMSTALQIPGGVVASAKSDGGSVTMDSRSLVEVTAVRKAAALRYARPVS